jgi:hypothetical protein
MTHLAQLGPRESAPIQRFTKANKHRSHALRYAHIHTQEAELHSATLALFPVRSR